MRRRCFVGISKTVKCTRTLATSQAISPGGPGRLFCNRSAPEARGFCTAWGSQNASRLGGVFVGKILRHITEKEPCQMKLKALPYGERMRRSHRLLLGGIIVSGVTTCTPKTPRNWIEAKKSRQRTATTEIDILTGKRFFVFAQNITRRRLLHAIRIYKTTISTSLLRTLLMAKSHFATAWDARHEYRLPNPLPLACIIGGGLVGATDVGVGVNDQNLPPAGGTFITLAQHIFKRQFAMEDVPLGPSTLTVARVIDNNAGSFAD